jgi:hypothetical protein
MNNEVLESKYDDRRHNFVFIYITDQGSPCPLVTLNPFGRELLHLDVFTGFKRSTWIQRIYDHVLTIVDHDHEGHEGHVEPKPLIFKVRPVL